MKTRLIKFLPLALLSALLTTPAFAIKITVPKQYEGQVEAIKRAEEAQRDRQLNAVESGDSSSATGESGNSGGLNFSVTDEGQGSNEPEPGAEPGADEFLVQSIAEASNTAAEFEQEAPENMGFVSGQIVDKESGQPVSGVAILLEGTDIGTITDSGGRYTLGPAPAGEYTINFVKSGYIPANVAEFAVAAGEVSVFPFAMPPRPAEMSDAEYVLTDFTVTADEANQLMANIDLRVDSDAILDLFSKEDFSKFAAGDVSEAISRVAGISVVEGEFAVIRGLSDRYSSTTLNGAVIPSPDPVRQSVQLDLFPSEVVNNLAISKSFSPELPGNSAAGNINILTYGYPEELTITVKTGTGFNDNAFDQFLRHEATSGIGDIGAPVPGGVRNAPYEYDFGLSAGATRQLFGREVRWQIAGSREQDYQTRFGYEEERSARGGVFTGLVRARPDGLDSIPPGLDPDPDGDGIPPNRRTLLLTPTSLARGLLPVTEGRFDVTESQSTLRELIYLSGGLDLDEEGNHKIDGLFFYVDVEEENVRVLDNGDIGLDRSPGTTLLDITNQRTALDSLREIDASTRIPGGGYSSIFFLGESDVSNTAFPSAILQASESDTRQRELKVFQLNGDHTFWGDSDNKLNVTWAANYAETSQEEQATNFSYFYQPAGDPEQLSGPEDVYALIGNNEFDPDQLLFYLRNSVSEEQKFVRMDGTYQLFESNSLSAQLGAGFHYEYAERDAESLVGNPQVGSGQARQSPTQIGLWQQVSEFFDPTGDGIIDANDGFDQNINSAVREVNATNFRGKFTLFDRLDLLGGVRFEHVNISTQNTSLSAVGGALSGGIFPTRYFLLDDPTPVSVTGGTNFSDPGFEGFPDAARGTPANFELLGLNLPVPRRPDGSIDLTGPGGDAIIAGLINTEIDENLVLPSLGATFRVMDGLNLRFSYSQTEARPSLREVGYYISEDPNSGELSIGNPFLTLSATENYDLRAEWFFGDRGDLIALSFFMKEIEDPIEQIVLADLITGIQYRTFFNNPNEATVRGIEFEVRKNLGFLGDSLEYFTIGGNVSLIDASVDRSDAQLDLANSAFNYTDPGVDTDPNFSSSFSGLERERRLFNQPEYIYNADVTFVHPDWGTTATLAFFAISDVLQTVGGAQLTDSGAVQTYNLDEYAKEFYQIDLILRQKWKNWTFTFSAKNLTDSKRGIMYDPNQTATEITKEEFRVGRDYSISASYSF